MDLPSIAEQAERPYISTGHLPEPEAAQKLISDAHRRFASNTDNQHFEVHPTHPGLGAICSCRSICPDPFRQPQRSCDRDVANSIRSDGGKTNGRNRSNRSPHRAARHSLYNSCRELCRFAPGHGRGNAACAPEKSWQQSAGPRGETSTDRHASARAPHPTSGISSSQAYPLDVLAAQGPSGVWLALTMASSHSADDARAADGGADVKHGVCIS
jgi:hypothetical protein